MAPNLNDVKKFETAEIPKSLNPFYFSIDSNLISDYRKKIYDSLLNNTKTNSFLILQGNKIAYQYFGKKEDSSNLNLLFSVSKSFVSSLISIALKEGFIKSFNDPLTMYLPELIKQDTGFKNITIQILLDMESNLNFDENKFGLNAPLSKLYYGKNLNKTLTKVKTTNSSKNFKYQNINTQLLMQIIERTTKQNFITYFNKKIWQPMGAQYNAKWLLDSKKNKTPKAFCGLNANVYDVAKLGYLYANNGKINNIQILDTGWINNCNNFEKHYTKSYANHWWMNHKVFAVKTEKEANNLALSNVYKISKVGNYYNIFKTGNCLIAEGILEQYLYIFPTKNLIIVRLGNNVPSNKTDICKMIEVISESF